MARGRTGEMVATIATVLLMASFGGSAAQEQAGSDEAIRKIDAQSEENWAYSVGVQNYVFGLSLVIFERERKLRLDPVALEKAKKFAPAAPINEVGHMQTLATADDVMPYTPNNDTAQRRHRRAQGRSDHPVGA